MNDRPQESDRIHETTPERASEKAREMPATSDQAKDIGKAEDPSEVLANIPRDVLQNLRSADLGRSGQKRLQGINPGRPNKKLLDLARNVGRGADKAWTWLSEDIRASNRIPIGQVFNSKQLAVLRSLAPVPPIAYVPGMAKSALQMRFDQTRVKLTNRSKLRSVGVNI